MNIYLLFLLFIITSAFPVCNRLNVEKDDSMNRNDEGKLPPRYVEDVMTMPSFKELQSFSYYSQAIYYKNVYISIITIYSITYSLTLEMNFLAQMYWTMK